MAKEIEVVLESFGFEISDIVSEDIKVIESIETNTPEIILMDININEKESGIDIAVKIKEHYDIPVIFITGYSDEDTVNKAKKAGPYGFIVKPIKYDELRIAIEIALYKQKMDRKVRELEKEKMIQEKMLLRNQRLSALGELSASIAHEIRQPLQVIKVIAESIIYWQKQKFDSSAELCDHMEDLEKIVSNTDRINTIIIQLQDLVKKDNREVERPIDINSQIERVLKFYTQKTKHHAIELKLALAAHLPALRYSEIAFEQILTNLLKNAIEAHDTTEKKYKFIEIQTDSDDHGIIMRIIDNATGIKKEHLEKILNPLFSTKQKPESMGLGLYIINTIIQANNGMLDYKNNNQGGVTFTINFSNTDTL